MRANPPSDRPISQLQRGGRPFGRRLSRRAFGVSVGGLLAGVAAGGSRAWSSAPLIPDQASWPSRMPAHAAATPTVATPMASLLPSQGGPLTISEPVDGGVGNPILPNGTAGLLFWLVHGRLVTMNDAGEIIPEVAESWSYSDDLTEITLELHPAAKWHDGSPVTSEDVLFTFDTIAREDVPFRVSDPLKLNGTFFTWSAPDSRTVTLTLPIPSAHVLPGLTGIGLLPKHLLENALELDSDPYNRAPVGCGPWRLESWHVGTEARLAPFDVYHLGAPVAERLTIRYQPTDEAVSNLIGGTVDVAFVTPIYQELLTDQPEIRLLTYPFVAPITLSFNFKHPVMTDADFRLAILEGIDKDALVAELGLPSIQRADHQYATGSLLDRYNEPTLSPSEFELEHARAVLDSDGFQIGSDGFRQTPDGESLSLPMLTYQEVPEYGAAVEILCRQLRENLQIAAEPRVVPLAELAAHGMDLDADPHERPWMVLEYPLPSDVDPDVWGSLHSRAFPPFGENVNFVSFPELDRLMDLSRETLDPAGRADVFHELDRRLHFIRPVIPLFQVMDAWAFRSSVGGYSPDTPNSRWLLRSASRFLSTNRS